MEKFLWGTVREIPDMPYGIEAAVALDTDGDHALCIRVVNDNGYYVSETHFAIGWLEKDKSSVDWLARIIGGDIKRAYLSGRKDKGREVQESLSGLKKLLGE